MSLQSVKYESRGWYITVQESNKNKIRGQVPSSQNELFEVLTIYGSTFALKAYNARATADSGSGDVISSSEDCFLGFSISDGRPDCYNSTDSVETHLLFLDAGLL